MTQEQLEEFARARVGTTLQNKWSLDGLLGVGGTASVYSARHKNGKRVALKVLHPELSAHEHFRERFLREAYVGNRIQHPGAITVYDNDVSEDGCAFLVMDLLEGENLEVRRERKGGVLEPLEVLSLMDAVLDTLQAAHDKGVVHRDIKPENLFLTVENTVRLLDFGIAHINVPQNPGQTLAGVSMGTPAFMPPEQASAHWDKVDAQSDIWAVGASMFTLLTGRYVHQGSTVNESLVLAVTKPAPRVEHINPRLPRPLSAIVNKALERDKTRRYQSATEMQSHVRQAYHLLQDEVPAGERYSLSDGIVAKHSLPPRVMNVPWVRGASIPLIPPDPGSLDAEPDEDRTSADRVSAERVSADPAIDRTTWDQVNDEELDRKSFRPPANRRWLFAGAALAALITLGVVFSGKTGKPEARPTSAAEQPQTAQTTKTDKSWSELGQPLPPDEAPAATSSASTESPEATEYSDEEEPNSSERRPRRGGGRGKSGSSGHPSHPGSDSPGSKSELPEDFDPLAERQ